MKNAFHKILITGGNGQLAHALSQHALATEFELINRSRKELDLTNLSSISNNVAHWEPDVIINTAAYTTVDKAEHETTEAFATNHLGAENLALVCKQFKTPLIHLSTDYVFDGKKGLPYKEDDITQPLNVYGKSKWLGEQAIRQQWEEHIILRVSGLFSKQGQNFYNTMLRLAKEKKLLHIIDDQITCPTYTGDIAGALFTILKQAKHWGTYHFCSHPPTSWHQFAETILQQDICAIKTIDYPTAALRPAYSVLDCDKIFTTYGIEQPSWKIAVEELR